MEINKADRMKYSRAKGVLAVVDDILLKTYNPVPVISRLTLPESDVLFHDVYNAMLVMMFPAGVDLTRKDELSYGTAYNLLSRGDTERNIGRKRQKKYCS